MEKIYQLKEKYDNKEKFIIYGRNFISEGTFIKLISIRKNHIDISFRCDILNDMKQEEKRDMIIDELLYNKNNNI